jgi:uncharacterized protein
MEIASIKGDTVLLLYHPAEAAANVGEQYAVLELPDRTEGLIVQIISSDSLEYAGLQQEMIQNILEERAGSITPIIDNEQGMGEIRSLKLATAKIRRRVQQGTWRHWDGWIPTRNVDVVRIDAQSLLNSVVPPAAIPINSFSSFDDRPIAFDGPRLNMVNVITGVKGSGKSHLAKLLLLALASKGVPVIVFDINGEYVSLPDVQPLSWGHTYIPDLAEVGYPALITAVKAVYPLNEGSVSEAVFENSLPVFFSQRQQFCIQRNIQFTVDIDFLKLQTWSTQQHVQDAIIRRLELVDQMGLFRSGRTNPDAIGNLIDAYISACDGRPIVFDMRQMSPSGQEALVRSVNRSIEDICNNEFATRDGRFPFVVFEEAHFYINETSILNIITRGRHIGMASVFVTNTPEKLPTPVFRQLDNLFLLSLSHRDDIRNVSKNSFTDEESIESFATRMPERHALVIGNVTDRYPLMVKVGPLPENVPATGKTRSTWDRFIVEADLTSVADGFGDEQSNELEDVQWDDDPWEEPPF